jgi:hypothetical protein
MTATRKIGIVASIIVLTVAAIVSRNLSRMRSAKASNAAIHTLRPMEEAMSHSYLEATAAAATNTLLAFYSVSAQQIEGRFVDTPSLPKLGYISRTADLLITNIAAVDHQKLPDYAIMIDTNGNETQVPSPSPPSLAVRLHSEDAKRFAELTKRAINKRLLVMLGDKHLIAPWVRAPIETGSFLIPFDSPEELARTEYDLKKLIR